MTAVVTKSSVFWDIMPYSPLKVNRSFRGTYRLHLQGWRISQSETNMKQVARFLCLPEIRGGGLPKRRLTLSGLHGVMSQKLQLFHLQVVYYHVRLVANTALFSAPAWDWMCEMAEHPILDLRTRGGVAKWQRNIQGVPGGMCHTSGGCSLC
jgi:hypothetical protein